jgi:phosphoserine aminotransferase
MRVHNFNPGPAALPLSVLERVREEMLDYRGTGMSIMEHSHRGKAYDEVHMSALSLVRELLAVPSTHEIVFMQGGAHAQFSLIPLNFLPQDGSADYIVTGGWAEKAAQEAACVGGVKEAARQMGVRIPKSFTLDDHAAFVHMTSNNTLEGTQYHHFPDTHGVPLVADMASDLFWRPFDVSKFAAIYACAQKNLGPSGVTVVILAKEFLARAKKGLPPSLSYAPYVEADSLYNTPPTFAIYMMRYVLEWTKEQGGLKEIEQRNLDKARLLYGTVDELGSFYRCPVEREDRSTMNAVFRLASEALEERFVKDAASAGLVGVKGHRSVGGLRVSMYNAVSLEDVRALCVFMRDFAVKNG